MSKRNDPHSVGNIIPENYRSILDYSLPTTEGGWPVPSFRINCSLDKAIRDEKGYVVAAGECDGSGRCCIVAMMRNPEVRWADHGTTGKCTVCGACFVHGTVWMHEPSGEYIHVGHTCESKYSMLAERGEYDAAYESFRQRTAAYRLAQERAEEMSAFLAQHPGLAEDLKVEHPIIRDIEASFRQWRSLSDKQIALVRKLANEVRNPPPPERHVPAPTGRISVRGKMVSCKLIDGDYGQSFKMTVKVETPNGTWLAWGTCPESIIADARDKFPGNVKGGLRGAEVEFTATLKRGNEQHFAILSRPTHGKVLTYAETPTVAA